MMEWLKDKKNQPKVIAGAVTLMVLSFLLIFFENYTPSHPTPPVVPEAPVASTPRGLGGPGGPGSPMMRPTGPTTPSAVRIASRPATSPGMPGRMPGGPGATSMPGGSAAQAAPAANGPVIGALPPPNVAQTPDPFKLSGKGAKTAGRKKPAATRPSLSNIILPMQVKVEEPPVEPLKPNLPPEVFGGNNGNGAGNYPRVAGILNVDGVSAIIEGQDNAVKPGDQVNGVGRVISIDSTGVTVRTDDNPPRTVRLLVSGAVQQPTGAGGYPGGQPGYPGMQPGYPGMQPGYPGGQPGYPGGQPGYPGGQPGMQPGYPGG